MSYVIQKWEEMRENLEKDANNTISEENWQVLQDLFGVFPNESSKEEYQTIKKCSASMEEYENALIDYLYMDDNSKKLTVIQFGKIIKNYEEYQKVQSIILIQHSKDEGWEVYFCSRKK